MVTLVPPSNQKWEILQAMSSPLILKKNPKNLGTNFDIFVYIIYAVWDMLFHSIDC